MCCALRPRCPCAVVGASPAKHRPRAGPQASAHRADDEIYKDILKFHVYAGTRVGVVFVPRCKWISSRRTDTNFAAALKALAFADSFMDVDALAAVSYDWEQAEGPASWRLVIVDGA